MAKDPNMSNDMQGRIKIPVLTDLFRTEDVGHLNMLCVANTEYKTSSTFIGRCKYFELNLEHFLL